MDAGNFPDDPVTVHGWGVLRRRPWDLDDIFGTKQEAETRRAELGDDYIVRWGAGKPFSDDFVYSESDQPTSREGENTRK